MSSPPPDNPKPVESRWRWRIIFCGFFLLALVIEAAYLIRPDCLAAFTVFPIWFWTTGPALISLILANHLDRRYLLGCCLMLGVMLHFEESPWTYLRSVSQGSFTEIDRKEEQSLRVITINCHKKFKSLIDLAQYEPDVVFIQETIPPKQLELIKTALFGSQGFLVTDFDTSILSRYPLRQLPLEGQLRWFSAAAYAEIEGQQVLLTSIHLCSPPLRLDLWNINCWQSYQLNRERQRLQLQALLQTLPEMNESTPVILGGDFNAPANDAIYREFSHSLQDSFAQAGVGWAGTFSAEMPVLRIDQLWTTPVVIPRSAQSLPSSDSDHRLVMIDYALKDQASRSLDVLANQSEETQQR